MMDMKMFIGLLPGKGVVQILYEIGLFIRSQHEIYAFNLADCLGRKLGVTSRNDDKSPGIFTCHPMNYLTTLVVSHLCHGTSINQTYISQLIAGRRYYTHIGQKTLKGRRL